MSEFKIKIKIDIEGIDDTVDYLDGVKKRMKDYRPVWPSVNKSLKTYMIENFTAQGLPSGGWKPLAPEYASWKQTRFPGSPLLVQNGNLFQKVASGPKLDGGHRVAHFSFTGKIARFHQYGTSKMPARPILFTPEIWADEVQDAISNYIMDGEMS